MRVSRPGQREVRLRGREGRPGKRTVHFAGRTPRLAIREARPGRWTVRPAKRTVRPGRRTSRPGLRASRPARRTVRLSGRRTREAIPEPAELAATVRFGRRERRIPRRWSRFAGRTGCEPVGLSRETGRGAARQGWDLFIIKHIYVYSFSADANRAVDVPQRGGSVKNIIPLVASVLLFSVSSPYAFSGALEEPRSPESPAVSISPLVGE